MYVPECPIRPIFRVFVVLNEVESTTNYLFSGSADVPIPPALPYQIEIKHVLKQVCAFVSGKVMFLSAQTRLRAIFRFSSAV
jgi:hypothetical protein